MTFDKIMERSGLDPNGAYTSFFMAVDELNFDDLAALDVFKACLESKSAPLDNSSRTFNLAMFAFAVSLRAHDPSFKGVLLSDPATRLQAKSRVVVQ